MVILAAGFSRRLGQSKALARVHGTPLLESAVRLLGSLAASRIIVVVPPRARRLRAHLGAAPVTIIENRARSHGLSTSVRRGVQAARASAAVLLMPVDLGELERRDIAHLISRWRGARRCLIARRLEPPGGGPAQGGIPAIVPRWLYPLARSIAGDQGLKPMIERLPADWLRLVDLPSAERDVDTPADLARARRRRRRGQPSVLCTKR